MDTHINFIRKVTNLLDKEYKFFGYRFGLDPVIGLIPIFGDALPVIFGLYFLWIGKKLNMPKKDLARIFFNSSFDFTLGLIPVVGDFSDVVYKANCKNLEILEKHLKSGNVIEGVKVI